MIRPFPVIGETYPYFDDGKIRLSRLEFVTIDKIVAFNYIDDDVKKLWLDEISCSAVYNDKTDYFIFAHDNTNETYIFVRSKLQAFDNYDWFSLGYNAGRLDDTGYLFSYITKNKIR